jgi:hypothetical protein
MMLFKIYAGKTTDPKEHKFVEETKSIPRRNFVVDLLRESGQNVSILTYYPDGTVCASQYHAKAE